MKSRSGIFQVPDMLLLIAGMAAGSQMLSRYQWSLRPESTDLDFEKNKAENRQRTNQLKRATMAIVMHLLRCLSLLQLQAGYRISLNPDS